MGLFKEFSFKQNDLTLTEHLNWNFDSSLQNNVKEWTFINVEFQENLMLKLNTLIEYEEDCIIDINTMNKNFVVLIKGIFPNFNLEFICSDYSFKERNLNENELIRIINNIEIQSKKNDTLLNEYSSNISELRSFIKNQIVRKERILSDILTLTNNQKIKTKAELDILIQIKNKIN